MYVFIHKNKEKKRVRAKYSSMHGVVLRKRKRVRMRREVGAGDRTYAKICNKEFPILYVLYLML